MSAVEQERAGRVEPLAPQELARLPVFPLPNVVFFPGSRLPLHLFEPRYRAMIEDCITKGPMAIAVTLLEPGYEADYEGRPPIHQVCGAGRILTHERLPDGRYNVLLYGLTRVRLEELPPDDEPYRRAKATPLCDETPPGGVPHASLLALQSCASAVDTAVRKRHPGFSLDLPQDAAPGRLADLVADRLVADMPARQRILETLDVAARVDRVTEAVSGLLSMVQGDAGDHN